MRFRSILLLGVSSVALQHADAQTAGVNGVPGSTVIVPRQVFVNRPIYVLPGNPGTNQPGVTTPTPATPIYMPPSPFGPGGHLPLVTGGLPGYNAPLNQMPIPVTPAPQMQPQNPANSVFGGNAPIVGQSPLLGQGTTTFASQQPGMKQNP
jgi:hypothetical protein